MIVVGVSLTAIASGRRTHLVRRTGGAAVGPTAHSLGGVTVIASAAMGSAGTGGR